MIGLIRKIRQKFIIKQAYKEYFKYAFGELILVVLGILIALQINNWNEVRKQNIKVKAYCEKISEEITSMVELIDYNTKYYEGTTNDLYENVLFLGANKNTSDDFFKKKLKVLLDCDAQTLYFPVINEFLDQGYLVNINDNQIRKQFEHFKYYEMQIKVNDDLRNEFCIMQLQPYIQKNINYADVMLKPEKNKHFNLPDVSVKSGPETDYNKLRNSVELWNLLYRKIEIQRETIIINKSLIRVLSKLKLDIDKFKNKL